MVKGSGHPRGRSGDNIQTLPSTGGPDIKLIHLKSKNFPLNILVWLEHDANNTEVAGSILVWAIHSRVRLDDPFGFFPTQNIL